MPHGSHSPSLEPLPYYKWFPQKYRSNRRVQRAGYIARGLYRELIDEQWLEGSIPSEIEQLADICDCPVDVMHENWPSIAGCFEVGDDGRLRNPVIEIYRTVKDAERVDKKNAGRKGGLAKAKQELASARQVPSKSEHMLSTSHIEEESRGEKSISVDTNVSTSVHGASADGPRDADPEQLIYSKYPRKEGHRAALKQIQLAVVRIRNGETGEKMAPLDARRYLYSRVREYARSPAGLNPDKTKIPMPKTWFSQSRYLDGNDAWQAVNSAGGASGNRSQSRTDGNIAAAEEAYRQLTGDADWPSGVPAGSGEQPDERHIRSEVGAVPT